MHEYLNVSLLLNSVIKCSIFKDGHQSTYFGSVPTDSNKCIWTFFLTLRKKNPEMKWQLFFKDWKGTWWAVRSNYGHNECQ